MNFELFKNIIDKLKQDKTDFWWIALAGGEPMLNKDLVKMAKYALDQNLRVVIASNWVIQEQNKIEELKQSWVKDFIISLPSLSEEKFSEMCWEKEGLSKIKKTAINLRKVNSNVALAFTATKMNITDFENVMKFAFVLWVNELQVNRFCVWWRWLKYRKLLELSDNEFEKLLEIANEKSEWKIKVVFNMWCEPCIFEHSKYPNLKFGKCECGLKKWTFDIEGNLRVCEQDSKNIGNILEDSFDSLVSDSYVSEFNKRDLFEKCWDCNKYDICRGWCRFRN